MSETSVLEGNVDPALLDERQRFPVDMQEAAAFLEAEIPLFLDDPFQTDAFHWVPNETPLDLPKFIQLVGRVIENAQEQVDEKQRVKFVGEYPAESIARLGNEVITWRVMRRAPASTGRAGGGMTLPQWQHQYSPRSPKDPNKIVNVELRLVDNVIAFSCWSPEARLASARVLWLERLLINNTWVFQSQGADFFQWRDRSSDVYTTTNDVRLYYRTLQFDVRLPEFRVKADPVIQVTETSIEPRFL